MSVSKSAKPILIGVIVIVVAALAILAFTVIFPPKEEPQLEEEPADTAAEEVYYVIKEDGNTLTQIKAFYEDGETLTITMDQDGESQTTTGTFANGEIVIGEEDQMITFVKG